LAVVPTAAKQKPPNKFGGQIFFEIVIPAMSSVEDRNGGHAMTKKAQNRRERALVSEEKVLPENPAVPVAG